mmetsp:Transcript_40050/g.38585  ORF Transcript_40050/g.38585 Transcript_40050/m.38585 type:complete len:109 (-) Transcript_40050:849-1175(-)
MLHFFVQFLVLQSLNEFIHSRLLFTLHALLLPILLRDLPVLDLVFVLILVLVLVLVHAHVGVPHGYVWGLPVAFLVRVASEPLPYLVLLLVSVKVHKSGWRGLVGAIH